MRDLVMQGLAVLVKMMVLIVGGMAISYINKYKKQIEIKIGKDTFEHMQAAAKTIMYAVEQAYPNLQGDKKYFIVADALNEKFGNKLTDKEIEMLIEAAVGEMNVLKGQVPKVPSETIEGINPTAENSNPVI